jgi:hypothetical protein
MPMTEKDWNPRHSETDCCYFGWAGINQHATRGPNFTDLNDLSVDAEYNKRGKDPKTIQNKKIENQITPSKPKGAWPDIILHERGNDNRNKLVIEFKKKKNRSSRLNDINKLEAFTDQKGNYKYVLGALVVLHDELEETKKQIQYFCNGEPCDPLNCDRYTS